MWGFIRKSDLSVDRRSDGYKVVHPSIPNPINASLVIVVGTAEALSCIRATQELWYRADLQFKTILIQSKYLQHRRCKSF